MTAASPAGGDRPTPEFTIQMKDRLLLAAADQPYLGQLAANSNYILDSQAPGSWFQAGYPLPQVHCPVAVPDGSRFYLQERPRGGRLLEVEVDTGAAQIAAWYAGGDNIAVDQSGRVYFLDPFGNIIVGDRMSFLYKVFVPAAAIFREPGTYVRMLLFNPSNGNLCALVDYGIQGGIFPAEQAILQFDANGNPTRDLVPRQGDVENSLVFTATFAVDGQGNVYANKVLGGIDRYDGNSGAYAGPFLTAAQLGGGYPLGAVSNLLITPDRQSIVLSKIGKMAEYSLAGALVSEVSTGAQSFNYMTFVARTRRPIPYTPPNRPPPYFFTEMLLSIVSDPARVAKGEAGLRRAEAAGLWNSLDADGRDALVAYGLHELGALWAEPTKERRLQQAVREALGPPQQALLDSLIAVHGSAGRAAPYRLDR